MSLEQLKVEFPRFHEIVDDDYLDYKIDPHKHMVIIDVKDLLELLRYGF